MLDFSFAIILGLILFLWLNMKELDSCLCDKWEEIIWYDSI